MKSKHTPDYSTTMVLKPVPWAQWLIVILCLLWSLSAFAEDSDEYLREAQAYLNKDETGAAVIQLKNALLLDPDNREARLLLGKAYLKQKDGLSAEKELRRAQELGAAREAVLPSLGQALLITGAKRQAAADN
jgi:Flp pilus assembly protein TadD